jgi:predicted nucleic acid-binding Zn finger protein
MSLASDIKFIIDVLDRAVTNGDSSFDSVSAYKVDVKEIINMIVEYGADMGDDLIDLKDVVLSIF